MCLWSGVLKEAVCLSVCGRGVVCIWVFLVCIGVCGCVIVGLHVFFYDYFVMSVFPRILCTG